MIIGTHAIVYAENAERARAFFRETLGWPNIDAHGGWLIFKLPPAELGVHPASDSADPSSGAPSGHHELYLLCDDIDTTVAELSSRGVEFTSPVENQGFGRIARFKVPGGGEMGIYEPRHQTAYDLES